MAMLRPTYKAAIQWVAYEDNPTELDVDTVANSITVALVADMFGVILGRVAADVVKLRKLDAAHRAQVTREETLA